MRWWGCEGGRVGMRGDGVCMWCAGVLVWSCGGLT